MLLERMQPTRQSMAEKLRERQPEPKIECPGFDADHGEDPLYDCARHYVEQSTLQGVRG